jgi:hypothetical protein
VQYGYATVNGKILDIAVELEIKIPTHFNFYFPTPYSSASDN